MRVLLPLKVASIKHENPYGLFLLHWCKTVSKYLLTIVVLFVLISFVVINKVSESEISL